MNAENEVSVPTSSSYNCLIVKQKSLQTTYGFLFMAFIRLLFICVVSFLIDFKKMEEALNLTHVYVFFGRDSRIIFIMHKLVLTMFLFEREYFPCGLMKI